VVVFSLRHPMLLRVTVVRVYPTCDVVGTFRVRGRAGVNRVPFRGRLHGRPLASGTYRLLIGARRLPSAEATIVVARGKVSARHLRKARRANACVPVLPIGFNSAAPSFPTPTSGASGGPPSNEGIATAIVSAAKGAVKRGKALLGRTEQALEDPAPLSTFVLVLVGTRCATGSTGSRRLIPRRYCPP
jgi:hypothetical protein